MISYGIYNGESPFTRDASHNFSALSSWSVATQKSHFGRVLKPQKLKSGGGGGSKQKMNISHYLRLNNT